MVCESFSSFRSITNTVVGMVDEHHPLVMKSLIPNRGVIFSAGIKNDSLSF